MISASKRRGIGQVALRKFAATLSPRVQAGGEARFAQAFYLGTFMSSPTDPASFPEPLPADLKAILELNEHAQASSWKYDWPFYVVTLILAGWWFFIAWQSIGKNENQVATLFPFVLLTLVIFIALHVSAERRAQRRLQLLLQVIRGLQRRAPASPNA